MSKLRWFLDGLAWEVCWRARAEGSLCTQCGPRFRARAAPLAGIWLLCVSAESGCVSQPTLAPELGRDAGAAFFDAEGAVLRPPTGPELEPRPDGGPAMRWLDALDASDDGHDGAAEPDGARRSPARSTQSGEQRASGDAGLQAETGAPRWIEAPNPRDSGASKPQTDGTAASAGADAATDAEADGSQEQASDSAPSGASESPSARPRADGQDSGGAERPVVRTAVAGALVINEWMADPRALSDAAGEWLELWNPGPDAIDLSECALGDGSGELAPLAPPAIMAAGAYASVARSETPGFTPDLIAGFTLTNSADVIELVCAGTLIDRVAYDKAQGFALRAGAATALDPARASAADNDQATSWCLATEPFATDLGTPGRPNSACPSVASSAADGP